MGAMQEDFWNTKPLSELTDDEWEALCDGCGRCCVHSFIDEQTAERKYTNVACRLLDGDSCRCRRYPQRTALVGECLDLKHAGAQWLDRMPQTCAYRLRARGQPLPSWHPLVSGRAESVHEAGISVRGKVISEQHVHPRQRESQVIDWIE